VTTKYEDRRKWRVLFEGAVGGLAYATTLLVLSVFAAGSFRPEELPKPYWARLPGVRTDTIGVICFCVATLSGATADYLRLTRSYAHSSTTNRPRCSARLLAIARALTVAASAVVIYLSINAITHPRTLSLRATHFISWPTEGTLRVAALVFVGVTAATTRTQQITLRARPGG
jgi:hypothetical protein